MQGRPIAYPTFACCRNNAKNAHSRATTLGDKYACFLNCFVCAYLAGAADKQLPVVQQQRADRRRDAAQRLEARAVRALGQVQSAIVTARVLLREGGRMYEDVCGGGCGCIGAGEAQEKIRRQIERIQAKNK